MPKMAFLPFSKNVNPYGLGNDKVLMKISKSGEEG